MVDRPRVLLVFEPPDGGVPEVVAELALGLKGNGYNVNVVGPPEASVYPVLDAAGLAVHRLPELRRSYRNPLMEMRAVRALRNIVRSEGITLVHAHSSKAGALARLALAQSRGVPVVYSPHCFGFVGEVPRARKVAALTAERALAGATGHMLCDCEDERRLALRHRLVAPSRLSVSLLGRRGPPDTAQANSDLLRFRSGGRLVAAVNVLRPQKRNDILLNATPAILREIPDLRVAIVGNGPLARELESQAADLGLSDHPRFAFFRFADSFAAYMRALDGFILPSSWEGLPLAVIDALACGTPQVVTAVGGVPEAVTPDTGVLVPPGDSDALALGVVRLLRSSAELDRRRVASIERHRALFTVERMIAGAIATYEAVVDKRLQHCE